MKRASLNRARSLCLGVLLSAAIASGLGVGSKGEAGATRSSTASATLEAPMTATGQPEVYFVPKVVEQFNALSLRPDGLAFGIGGSPNPSLNKHYQGIVRKPGSGTPYLFVSRSGNDTPTCGGCGDDVANLLIVRMGSRDTNGERLRTNRLIRDWVPHVRDSDGQPVLDSGGNPVPWTKPPDPRDTTVAHISFDGDYGWPQYGHAGGMQLVGDVLAVPLAKPYSTEYPEENLILFLDVANPETPVLKSKFFPAGGSSYEAGLVGLTPVLNPLSPSGPGRRYLMITTGNDNKDLRLYRSRPTNTDGSTDLKSTELSWEPLASVSESQLQSCFDAQTPGCDTCAHRWPDGFNAHQTLNFVREGGPDGALFLIGARNTFFGGDGADLLDLYRVDVDVYGNPGGCLLEHVTTKHVTSYPYNGHGDSAAFSAASGVYVSPSGELIVYGAEYENDGPYELLANGQPGKKTVRFGEWRHREMVDPDSPTLRPTVEVPGPFEVDEGSTINIAGQGKGPITKAWIQLFEDDGAGLSLPDLAGGGAWLAVEYEDWGKDNFDDFSQYDARTDTDFNDNAGSWRWFAPEGCTVRANEDQFFATTGTFPGSHTKTLHGNGEVDEKTNLDAVPSDANDGVRFMDDVISSVQFFPTADVEPAFPDCRVYYNAPISVDWDFNLDNVFETRGQNPNFSAAELDGPAVQTVLARGQHPTDTGPLGQGSPITVGIKVRNVAPTITNLSVVDSLGRVVGRDVPFVLANLEYSVQGSFTDPGKPDHQTAVLKMGDGATFPGNAFEQFSDAFGGVMGQLRKSHTYATSGTFTISLEVIDDDGGQTTAELPIRVLSPTEALQFVIDEIDARLAVTTDPNIQRALLDARDDLAGNNNDAAYNGAQDHLARDNFVAALVKVKSAIEALERAEAAGSGSLSSWKYSLGLTSEAIAEAAYLRAVASMGEPNSAEATQLERIRASIVAGHALLAAGEYASALDEFKDAAARSA